MHAGKIWRQMGGEGGGNMFLFEGPGSCMLSGMDAVYVQMLTDL